mgnify:CR=1 FL=1
MTIWKEALWLAKFELKKIKLGFAITALLAVFFSMFFCTVIPENLIRNRSTVMLDMIFLIVFGIGTTWLKPKDFNHQKVNRDFWVPPFIITLRQLPIKLEAFIKSRFIIFFTFAIPYYILISILTYCLSPELRETLDVGTYAAFMIIWISIGIHIGASFPASDVGVRMSTTAMVIYLFVLLFGLIAILTLFNLFYGNGFVSWTMSMAKKQPILSSIAAILFAYVGLFYSQKYMSRRIKKTDYVC